MKAVCLCLVFALFFSCSENGKIADRLRLEKKLSGKWVATAFDGELHEVWHLNDSGWMQQEGYYIENGDTLYAAQTQIQGVGNDTILFSVIKDANPKIFKSIHAEENKIIFENDDYKNPYQVHYEFLTAENYRRTIRGRENDSLVEYEFNFKKVD